MARISPVFRRIQKSIHVLVENHWVSVFSEELSAFDRALIAMILFSAGVASTYALFRLTNHFFSSIDMAIIVFISIYAGPTLGVISGVSITLLEDYLFIGDVGKVLNNSESVERFFVLSILTIIVSVLTSSIRSVYAKTIEARREADRARKDAEQATKSKTAFLATVSHEIRTPLNGIIGLSDVLCRSKISQADLKMVEMIHDSGKTLLKIINDILDYSKIESSHVTLEMDSFSILDAIEQVVLILAPKASEKSIGLETVIDEMLPSKLVGDATRLTQVLYNLIGNAIKFTAVGSVILRVRYLGLTPQNSVRVLFSVTDTGQGIPEDEMHHLMQPFTQLQRPGTTGEAGTGLGLSICRQILLAMGSDLKVESQTDRGSRFFFELDFAEYSIDKVQLSSHGMMVQRSKLVKKVDLLFNKPSILVVEDNVTNQVTARAMLERMGAKVILAGNGRESLDLVRQTSFDLILMDCQMPVMDGFAATTALRNLGVMTPVVAMTANAYRDDREACIQAGMSGFVSKPMTFESLASAIRPFLEVDPRAVEVHTLEFLGESIGHESLVKVVTAYISSLTEMRNLAFDAFDRGAIDVLNKLGHQYKSSSGTVGASGLAALFAKLESTSDLTDIANLLNQIGSASQEVARELEASITRNLVGMD